MPRRIAVVLLLSTILVAQEQAPTPPSDDSFVFKVSTSLVQIDAAVTDSRGNAITDLTAKDFRVTVDGKPQPIVYATYVRTVPSGAVASNPAPADNKALPSHRRTVAVVDDLGLTFEGMYYTRRTLHKFIDTEMQPGNEMAIWETGRNNGMFRQFTSDKRVLSAAIDALHWNLNGRGNQAGSLVGNDSRLAGSDPQNTANTLTTPQQGTDDLEANTYALGTLDAIIRLLDALREVGGRKSMVLFSDGLGGIMPNITGSASHWGSDEGDPSAMDRYRMLIDKANRSGTVIYSLDMRGLVPYAMGPRGSIQAASNALFISQEGLRVLADETGGFAFTNSNDYLGGLKRAVDDQNGYYLIGFKPSKGTTGSDEATAESFHKAKVSVDLRGVHVRSRTGFFGATDQVAARPKYTTPEQQLRAAMTSLFSKSDIRLRLTTLYRRSPDGSAFVRNVFYLDSGDVAFKPGPSGKSNANLDFVAVALGAGSKPIASVNKRLEISANPDQLARLQREGIQFTLDVPVNEPGPYQLQVGVRDEATAKIGSAGQFIEVPDLKKRQIALTSMAVDEASAGHQVPFGSVSGLRQFRRGSQIQFFSMLESEDPVQSSTQPDEFKAQLLIFHDGEQLYSRQLQLLPVRGGEGHALAGKVSLSDAMVPGQYFLEAVITDNRGKHPRTATTWADFDLVP